MKAGRKGNNGDKPGCKVTMWPVTQVEGPRVARKEVWPEQCARPVAPGSLMGLCEKHEADRQRLLA